eukprot:6862247-Pyramimonas_sp.AAC.1
MQWGRCWSGWASVVAGGGAAGGGRSLRGVSMHLKMFRSARLRAWVSVIAPMQGSPSGPTTVTAAGVGLGAIRLMIL